MALASRGGWQIFTLHDTMKTSQGNTRLALRQMKASHILHCTSSGLRCIFGASWAIGSHWSKTEYQYLTVAIYFVVHHLSRGVFPDAAIC